MRILCWNIRGLGSKGRRKQHKEWVVSQNVEVICLQEIMKDDFSIAELRGLVTGQNFAWNWTASAGHSGGTLLGVKQCDLDAIVMDEGEFFSSITIENRKDNFWEVINVYGPVKKERKGVFLQELYQKIQRC
jgi:exonuclease III